MNLATVDYIYLGWLAAGLVFGFKRGLAAEVAKAIRFIGSLGTALYLYPQLSDLLLQKTTIKDAAAGNWIAFIVILLGAMLGFRLIGMLFGMVLQMTFTPAVQRLGGGLAGLLKSGLALVAFILFVTLSPFSYVYQRCVMESTVGKTIEQAGLPLYRGIASALPMLNLPSPEENRGSLDESYFVPVDAVPPVDESDPDANAVSPDDLPPIEPVQLDG